MRQIKQGQQDLAEGDAPREDDIHQQRVDQVQRGDDRGMPLPGAPGKTLRVRSSEIARPSGASRNSHGSAASTSRALHQADTP